MTFEFKTVVSPTGQITVPSDIAGQIPPGKELRVVLTSETPAESASSYRALSQAVGGSSSKSVTPAEETVYDSLA